MQDTNVLEFPAKETNPTDDLTALQGVAERTQTITVTQRRVAIDGDKIVEIEVPVKVFVRPLPFRRWALVLGHMQSIIGNLPQGNFDLSNEVQLAMWIATAIGKVPDDIFGVLSLATDQPVTFFDEIDLDEGMQIVFSVVAINKDFFVQKVLPLVSEKVPELKAAMATFGQTA